MAQYYTLVTNLGTQKIAKALATGEKLNITSMQIGDGGGSYYEPSVKQTSLKNAVHEIEINSIKMLDEENRLTIEGIIPANVGGFYIREVGIFDTDGDLIAIGKYSETYKADPTEGTAKEIIIRLVMDIENAESVNISINANMSIVTRDELNAELKSFENKINKFGETSGINNKYQVKIQGIDEYTKGIQVSILIHKDNTGESFLNINELGNVEILDPNKKSLKAGALKSEVPYNLIYNGTAFILQGKGGGGNATPDKVLIGYNATTDDGEIIGAMPDNGVLNGSINCGETFNIPSGYSSGGVITANSLGNQTSATAQASHILSGQTAWVNGSKVNGTMVNRGGATNAVSVGTSGTNKYFRIQQGAYITNANGQSYPEIVASATQIDSNIVASNIVSGKSICGVAGTAMQVPSTTPQAIKGRPSYWFTLPYVGTTKYRPSDNGNGLLFIQDGYLCFVKSYLNMMHLTTGAITRKSLSTDTPTDYAYFPKSKRLMGFGGRLSANYSLESKQRLYDLTNFTELEFTPKNTTHRYSKNCTDETNEISYHFGGSNGTSSPSDTGASRKFVLSTQTFSSIANCPLVGSGSATFCGGLAYMVSGESSSATTNLVAYNPSTNTYTTKGATFTGHFDNGVMVTCAGSVYALTSDTTLSKYNPTTDTFTAVTTLPLQVARAYGALSIGADESTKTIYLKGIRYDYSSSKQVVLTELTFAYKVEN